MHMHAHIHILHVQHAHMCTSLTVITSLTEGKKKGVKPSRALTSKKSLFGLRFGHIFLLVSMQEKN